MYLVAIVQLYYGLLCSILCEILRSRRCTCLRKLDLLSTALLVVGHPFHICQYPKYSKRPSYTTMNGAGQSFPASSSDLADAFLLIIKYSYFLVKISLRMHCALPVARLVIPLRGPAGSSAAVHDGLLRAFLICNHAYKPLTSLKPTLDHHVF